MSPIHQASLPPKAKAAISWGPVRQWRVTLELTPLLARLGLLRWKEGTQVMEVLVALGRMAGLKGKGMANGAVAGARAVRLGRAKDQRRSPPRWGSRSCNHTAYPPGCSVEADP